METKSLLEAVPAAKLVDVEALVRAVDLMQDCVAATNACSAAMLGGGHADRFAAAVANDLDCADVVATTMRVLIRRSGPGTTLLITQLEACLVACDQSNQLCAAHAGHHEHCRLCSQATNRCADVCRQLLQLLRR